jgi:hypothetical protein
MPLVVSRGVYVSESPPPNSSSKSTMYSTQAPNERRPSVPSITHEQRVSRELLIPSSYQEPKHGSHQHQAGVLTEGLLVFSCQGRRANHCPTFIANLWVCGPHSACIRNSEWVCVSRNLLPTSDCEVQYMIGHQQQAGPPCVCVVCVCVGGGGSHMQTCQPLATT